MQNALKQKTVLLAVQDDGLDAHGDNLLRLHVV